MAAQREVFHLSQIDTLSKKVGALEEVIKELYRNMGKSLTFQSTRCNEIVKDQSLILKLLREVALNPSSSTPQPHDLPPVATSSSRPVVLRQSVIDAAIEPINAQISELSSQIESVKDELKGDWHILRGQIMDVLPHPASEYAFLFDDNKKGEKKIKAAVEGKGKDLKIKESTTGKLSISPLASTIPPPRESTVVAPSGPAPERLNLAKAGEAQRLFEEK